MAAAACLREGSASAGPQAGGAGWGSSGSWATTAAAGELEGAWMNVDCPGERYFIEGLRVTRIDGRGARDFSIYWDQYKQRWRWGMHGWLSLQWLGDNMIAWAPDSPADPSYVCAWRWQRCGPGSGIAPSRPPSMEVPAVRYGGRSAAAQSAGSSSYGPSRPTRAAHSAAAAHPYARHPWRRDNQGEDSAGAAAGRRSFNASTRRLGRPCEDDHRRHWERDHRDHRDYRNHRDHRDHCEYRDHRDHRDHHDHRHRWSHSAPGLNDNESLPCGLTAGEVYSLLTREIQPEDYDLLLRLDEGVARPTVSKESVQGLPRASREEFMGRECGVCLDAFGSGDAVVALPCRHYFHEACITKWLTECRHTCPLCGEAVAVA
uniref:RING-type domain-containing protein n=1 Tax=Zooxanthella nutricula TaxID=1333877 RepID=A0A7S2K986_9DINO|mmetsp:Transcript_44399/g.134558  ORF Transcript_44399/g.134558 Transcript_44399/m.134558 type:complete len:375 (+) Transcript_44399:83-1207(+)